VSSPPPSPEDGNRSSFRNVFFGIPDNGKSPEKFCEFWITTYLTEYWKSDGHLPLQYWTGLFGKINYVSYKILKIW
jgi:hypothetical protein